MRLCSICDKKLEGGWCKNCHRFVKGYELSEGVYLNERHNPANDKECTYHTDAKSHETSHGSTSVTRPTYTGTQTATRPAATRTQTGTQKKADSRKKSGNAVLAIVIVAVNLVAAGIGAIKPVIERITHEVTEEVREEFRESFGAGSGSDITGDETDSSAQIAALERVEPVEIIEEENYRMCYYNPEDIRQLGSLCYEEHFAMSLSEFETWLDRNWAESYEMVEDCSPYYNYYYEEEDFVWLSFSSFREYYAADDFGVRAEYDTATEQLHALGFVSLMEKGYTDLYYATLQEFDPETEWTGEIFRANLKEALGKEEYTIFYTSDKLIINLEVREDIFSLLYYAYTE